MSLLLWHKVITIKMFSNKKNVHYLGIQQKPLICFYMCSYFTLPQIRFHLVSYLYTPLLSLWYERSIRLIYFKFLCDLLILLCESVILVEICQKWFFFGFGCLENEIFTFNNQNNTVKKMYRCNIAPILQVAVWNIKYTFHWWAHASSHIERIWAVYTSLNCSADMCRFYQDVYLYLKAHGQFQNNFRYIYSSTLVRTHGLHLRGGSLMYINKCK